MIKALVIGRGFLGNYVFEELKNEGFDVYSSFFSNKIENGISLDITNENMVEKILKNIRPDFVINCAANTNVDFLEDHPNIAYLINSKGAQNVALSCKKQESRLIHISTDSVFDGKDGMYKENDPPQPVNIYGKSKLEGEKFIAQVSSNYIIVRTNFFGYDSKGLFLFNWIVNSLRDGRQIIGFDDIIFTPLEISNLVKMISELMVKNFKGLIHLSSNEPISKYQFAIKIAKKFHLNENLITIGSVDEMKFKALRPKNTSLDNTISKNVLKTKPLSIESALTVIKKNYYNGIIKDK